MFDWFAYGNPNLPAKTLGGYVFWHDVLKLSDGTRVQQNEVDNHYRVLDSRDRRIAWGNESAMRNFVREKLGVRKRLAVGDVIAIDQLSWSENQKGLFQHYAVYVGDGSVVHFAADGSDWKINLENVRVHRIPLSAFMQDAERCYVMIFSDTEHRPFQVMAAMNDDDIPEWMPAIQKDPDSPGMPDWSEDAHLYSGKETAERALRSIGTTQGRKYNLLYNNCEHFAMWCKTGKRQSWQSKDMMADQAKWIFERDRGPIVYA